jgi:glycosyltransferase involved in cell wall biosynthesis
LAAKVAFIDDNYLIWERIAREPWLDKQTFEYMKGHMLNEWYSYPDMYAGYLRRHGVQALKIVPSGRVKEVTWSTHRLGHQVVRVPVDPREGRLRSVSRFTLIALLLLKKNGVEIVHYNNYYSLYFIAARAFKLTSRLIAQYSGGEPPARPDIGWLMGPRLALRSTDGILIGHRSGEERRQRGILATYYGVKPRKLFDFPCLCVDGGLFFERRKEDAASVLGLDPDKINIMVISYIPKPNPPFLQKDPFLFLRLFANLEERIRKRCTVHLLGFGPGFDDLRNEARRAGLEKETVFYGLVDHEKLPLFYSASDVVVNPYRSFDLFVGTTTMEAFACVRPVMMFKRGPGSPDELPGGYLVDADKGDHVRLGRILVDAERLREKGRDGRSIAQTFMLEAVGSRLRQIYSSKLS